MTDTPPTDFRCPLCRRIVFHSYAIAGAGDDPMGRWLHCFCGCLFNLHQPDPATVFTEAYRKKLDDRKEIADRYNHYVRLFAPMIEERTYGRRFLDVGYGTQHIMEIMGARGWLVNSIDVLPPMAGSFQGNFEDYNFGGATYDCLWLGDVLQCFRDPAAAIIKCFELLIPNGLLFIATPDADLVRMGKFGAFGYWDMEENRQILTRVILERLLEYAAPTPQDGRFNILYAAHNFSQRFPTWTNLHVLAQKEAFNV